jgi:DNA-directed RNA polymerase specialized sigma24 family protein
MVVRAVGARCEQRAGSLTPERLSILQKSADYHARRVAGWILDASADIEDVRQTLLLAVWARVAQFDPVRASWSTFIDLLVRHAAWDYARQCLQSRRFTVTLLDDHGDVLLHDVGEYQDAFAVVRASVDVERAIESLPDHLRRLCRLLQLENSSVAQRLSGLSPAEFYRQVQDLRMRFRSLGLQPGGQTP